MSGLPLSSARGRWVVFAATLGSAIALLDGTVVNVALRPIGLDLGATVQDLQWVVNAYMLTLASLILVGGSLGDRLGRRRIFLLGIAWFGAASILCGLAQSTEQLIIARGLQGIGGALLTPGSLALIQSLIAEEDRARAIGIWSAWSGVAGAAGPLLGGVLVEALSWRWIFLINVPVAAVVIAAGLARVPESGGAARQGRFDLPGAALAVVALGGITIALIHQRWLPGLIGLAGLVAFLAVQARTRHPMLPLAVFANRTFSAVNVVTLMVYGALGALMFFLVLQLQVVAGVQPAAGRGGDHPVHGVDAHLLPARGGPDEPHRTAAVDDHWAGHRRGRGGAAGVHSRPRLLPGACVARGVGVRRGHHAAGHPADGDGARRGTRHARGAGQRGEQRGGAGCRVADRGRATGDGGTDRGRLPGAGGVQRWVYPGDVVVCGASGCRCPGCGGVRAGAAGGAPLMPANRPSRCAVPQRPSAWISTAPVAGRG